MLCEITVIIIIIFVIIGIIESCELGCIEFFFPSASTNKGNRKLPFDMGFKNIEKFFKNFNVSCSHQRAKVTENWDFL